MRKALPKGLVKRNISIPRSEAAKLDSLQMAIEASSDSEVTRQALRHLEQLIEDEGHGVTLKVVKGTTAEMISSDRFRDRPEETEDLIRRSLILHQQSDERLERLRVAMGAKDASEVVRCALRFYEEIVRASVHGAQFFARLPSGEELRVRFGSFAATGTAPVSTEPATRKASQQPQPPGQDRPGGSLSAPALASARSR